MQTIASAIINHLAVIHEVEEPVLVHLDWAFMFGISTYRNSEIQMRFRINLPGFQGKTPSSALFLYLAFSVHQNEKDSLSDYKHYEGL